MDEYVELLILAYFYNYGEEYDLIELKENLGISFRQLDLYLEQMLEKRKLVYSNYMLQLTEKGFIQLMTSKMKDYEYRIEEEIPEAHEIYEIHGFSKKKWRGKK